MIQDYIIALAGVALSYALVPQVRQGFRTRSCDIHPHTSATTAAGLFVMAGAGFTLGLFFSTVVWTITGVLWVVLLWQRLRYGSGG